MHLPVSVSLRKVAKRWPGYGNTAHHRVSLPWRMHFAAANKIHAIFFSLPPNPVPRLCVVPFLCLCNRRHRRKQGDAMHHSLLTDKAWYRRSVCATYCLQLRFFRQVRSDTRAGRTLEPSGMADDVCSFHSQRINSTVLYRHSTPQLIRETMMHSRQNSLASIACSSGRNCEGRRERMLPFAADAQTPFKHRVPACMTIVFLQEKPQTLAYRRDPTLACICYVPTELVPRRDQSGTLGSYISADLGQIANTEPCQRNSKSSKRSTAFV